MKASVDVIPAPKRGQYDRALSRHERQAAQQERVIAAVAAVSASGRELNVASVVEHAGIGRNTFYEYFDDVEHAVAAIEGRALRELAAHVESALQSARTPLERMRVLTRAWADSLAANPLVARLALRARRTGLDSSELSGLGSYLRGVLARESDARSALPGLADPLRIEAVSAVFEAVSRAQLAKQPAAVDELSQLLVDLSLRLLR
jgi:AcrR family transcriptional regulator